MFFSSKPTILIVLRPDGLVVYNRDKELGKLEFAEGLVRYQEVLDATALRQAVNQFLTDHHLKDERCVLVLNDELTFQKIIPRSQTAALPNAEETFLSMVPFEVGHRQVTSLSLKDHLVLLGVGTDLYKTVLAAVEAVGNKVMAVSILGLYGIKTASPTARQAASILAETDKTTMLNLLKVDIPQPKQIVGGNSPARA